MAEETKKSFIEMLQESTWLGADSKKNAILKLEKMGKMIGYPKEFEKKGALDKMFETVSMLKFFSNWDNFAAQTSPQRHPLRDSQEDRKIPYGARHRVCGSGDTDGSGAAGSHDERVLY